MQTLSLRFRRTDRPDASLSLLVGFTPHTRKVRVDLTDPADTRRHVFEYEHLDSIEVHIPQVTEQISAAFTPGSYHEIDGLPPCGRRYGGPFIVAHSQLQGDDLKLVLYPPA